MCSAPLVYLGHGRHRVAYRRGNYVIKVPLCEAGLHDNYYEANIYWAYRRGKLRNGLHYAACRIHPGGILVMRYAEPTVDLMNLPNWCYAVDCQQVGHTSTGVLVAYDYGYS